MRFRAMLALVAVVLGAFTFAPAALAEQCYPGSKGVSLAVSTTRPLPGEQITVSGNNFVPNTTIRLELRPNAHHLKTVTADSRGSFSTTVTLPDGVVGTHRIVAVGAAEHPECPGNPVAVIHIQTHGAEGAGAGPPGHHGTSFTGVDVLLIVLVAVALIGAGVALNRGGRRRRSSGHPLID